MLWSLGARPRIPEPLERIRVEVDLLVSESDQFDQLRTRAVAVTLDERTFLVASIDDLIAMKRRAGRPQDVLDIAQLQEIQRRIG